MEVHFLHEKKIYLPQARSDWIQLGMMDFPNLMTFNAKLHQITALLGLCRETIEEHELINKILTTFPLTFALFAQQYRNMKFKTHAELMSYLLMVERQQQLLLKNVKQRLATKETHTIEMAARRPKRNRGRQQFRGNPSKHQFSSKLKGKSFPNPTKPSNNNFQSRTSSGSQ